MTWRDRLRPASFRGVSFYVEDRSLEGGRRRARHEFFRRETVYLEDLGRRAREYVVRVHLLGDDYDLEREQLVRALEEEGPGELFLPHDAPLLATATDWTARESITGRGGIADFDITFEEQGELSTADDANRTAAARTKSRLFRDAVGEDYVAEAQVDGVPSPAVDAIAEETTALASIFAAADFLTDAAQDLASLETKLSGIISDAASLALSPAQLVVQARDLFETTLDAASSALGAMSAYRTLFGVERTSGLDEGLSVGSSAARNNATAANSLFRAMALGASAEAATLVSWESRSSAEAARDEMVAEIDLLELSASTSLFQVLQDLRASLYSSLPPPGSELPVAVEASFPTVRSSLSLAYDLFDDARREEIIVARNDIEHPGFIPAGEPLEVLVDNG